ncbi:MAG: hypothetical protein ACO1PZ_05790 [Gammaproteobacteria bacterium]
MKLREQHKLLGIALLLPFMAWSATGLFFLVRPAYEQAYEQLVVKTYPLEQPFPALPIGSDSVVASSAEWTADSNPVLKADSPADSKADSKLARNPDWKEVRWLRSILGLHLLVRRDDGWVQLDPDTFAERPWPSDEDLRLLVTDAMRQNPERYGELASFEGGRMTTDTGVEITFDWNTLSYTQQGRDTRGIDRVYRIHYLEWTGIAAVDKVLGVSGLLLLIYMTVTGFRLVFRHDRPRPRANAGLAASGNA